MVCIYVSSQLPILACLATCLHLLVELAVAGFLILDDPDCSDSQGELGKNLRPVLQVLERATF
jgi:hypothetical protein